VLENSTMNPLVRLVAPLTFGIVAAAINWMVVQSRTTAYPYVRVRQEVRAGEPIEKGALARVDLPGDPGAVRSTLVPFSDADVVIGTRAQRDLFPGDLLLWQDATRPDAAIPAEADERILPVDLSGVAVETSLLYPGSLLDFWIAPLQGDAPAPAPSTGGDKVELQVAVDPEAGDYRLIGPFRILSVGSRFVQGPTGDDHGQGGRGNERVITVAVQVQPDGRYDANSRQLLDAHAQKRIMAIALRPRVGGSSRAAAPSVEAIHASQPRIDGGRP
jgi:hypothetical protein